MDEKTYRFFEKYNAVTHIKPNTDFVDKIMDVYENRYNIDVLTPAQKRNNMLAMINFIMIVFSGFFSLLFFMLLDNHVTHHENAPHWLEIATTNMFPLFLGSIAVFYHNFASKNMSYGTKKISEKRSHI